MILPASLHEKFIKRGAIPHSEIFEDMGHGKFFAVMGVSDDMVAGFFFINSRIHPIIMSRPEQLAMQYPLKHTDYGFLKYDSFLCATAIRKIPLSKLAETVTDGKTTYVGDLTDNDLAAVLEACRASQLFRGSDKRKFFY